MVQDKIDNFLSKNKFSVRPTAGKGLWVFFLLPASLILTSFKHPIILSPTYKLATAISFILLCSSLYFIAKCLKNEKLKVFDVWSITIALSSGCLVQIWLQKGLIFCISTALVSELVYKITFKSLLVKLGGSFTLGEAGLISQGITLFLYCAFFNIVNFGNSNSLKSNMQISTLIIQVGLLGILTLAYTLYKFQIKNSKVFYALAFVILTAIVVVPLHVILKQSPVLWIFAQIFDDIKLLKLFIYWSSCVAVATLAISNQVYYAKRASTRTRKIFHILAVLVYLPGLYAKCSFLYMASGVILGIFFTLEILRLGLIPPLGSHLQNGYEVFKDDKDAGLLALTPIYLLVGVSLPIWIHPSPCDVTDSAQFAVLPLLSGLMSIGVGDTAASYVGSKIGRFKWANSQKTVEGTLACILSQLGCFYLLYYIGLLPYLTYEQAIKIGISVLVGSITEAKTTQIDNLVLPLLMYIILI